MKYPLFGPVSTPPVWVSVAERRPRKADSDRHERVWAVAIDASGRPYPGEAYWEHVREHSVYTHWAVPPVKEWLYPEEKKP